MLSISLGQIAAKRGKWAEANAYFQRVYVGYQKFLPWVAKAYIASGESFEKLGKTQEAANTYRELLRNEKLGNFTEAAEARKRRQQVNAQKKDESDDQRSHGDVEPGELEICLLRAEAVAHAAAATA